jgi:hypothetical protein
MIVHFELQSKPLQARYGQSYVLTFKADQAFRPNIQADWNRHNSTHVMCLKLNSVAGSNRFRQHRQWASSVLEKWRGTSAWALISVWRAAEEKGKYHVRRKQPDA